MKRPAFKDAIETLAGRQRRKLGEHPSPDHLLAYHVGELQSEGIERVQDHLAICSECSQLVLSLGSVSSPEAGMRVLSTGQDQVDSAWRRLQVEAATPSQEPTAKSPRFSHPLGYAAALAAAVLIGAWGASLWWMTQQPASPGALGGGSHIVALLSDSFGTTRGSQAVEAVPGDRQLTFSLALPPESSHSLYRVELRQPSASGSETLWQLELTPSGDTLAVWLPAGLLDSGRFEFRVWGRQGGAWELVDIYSGILEFQ